MIDVDGVGIGAKGPTGVRVAELREAIETSVNLVDRFGGLNCVFGRPWLKWLRVMEDEGYANFRLDISVHIRQGDDSTCDMHRMSLMFKSKKASEAWTELQESEGAAAAMERGCECDEREVSQ